MLIKSELMKKAVALAREKHKDQEYRGQNYYDGHIKNVVAVVKKHSGNLLVIVATVLHDIVEDTDVTIEQLKKEFGSQVADLVWRLTDESGINRSERKAKTYPKIRENKNAILIKLADRIVNTTNSSKMDMYKREYPEFRKALYVKGMWDKLWKELDRNHDFQEHEH